MSTCEVLVTGTFNIVHAGHCELLEFASRFGLVTVGVNSDWYLKEKYGDKAVPLLNRAYVLRSNRFVDKVVVFKERDPSSLILKLEPIWYIKGPDYRDVVLPEQDVVDKVEATLVIQSAEKIADSSGLLSHLNIHSTPYCHPVYAKPLIHNSCI